MIDQEAGIGAKRGRRAEKIEVDKERKTKKRCERDLTNDATASKETAVAAMQHRREP